MTFLEWRALVFCITAIGVMVLFSYLFGKSDCQNDCCHGRRCKCQKESLK